MSEENGGEKLGLLLFLRWPAAKEKGGGIFGVGNEEKKYCQMRVFSSFPLFILHFF